MPRACPSCHSIYSSHEEFCLIDGSHLVEDTTNDGRTIGRYKIIEHLGSGAMGAVYRAHDQERHVDVALKVLKADSAVRPPRANRFVREGKIAQDLDHPNIVSVFDSGSDGAVMFIAMELLDGETLARVLSREGRLPIDRAARIARQIAFGLSHAHNLGYVHRDLKPENVILTGPSGSENVKILDFGVVGVWDEGLDMTRLTSEGATVGSPAYMAPEQVGDASVEPRADLYALGVMLYEMLSGRVPFEGTITEVVLKQISERPPPLPPLGGIERVVMKMLEKDPGQRPSSALEVAEALKAYEREPTLDDDHTVVVEPDTDDLPQAPSKTLEAETADIGHRRNPGRRHRVELAVAALVAALALILSFWVIARNQETEVIPIEPRIASQKSLEPEVPEPQIRDLDREGGPGEEAKPDTTSAPEAQRVQPPAHKSPQKALHISPPAPIDPRQALRAQLRRINQHLNALQTRPDDPALDPLWKEYLELTSLLGPNASGARLDDLQTRAQVLERRVKGYAARAH